MSYILEALRKAEKQRHLGDVPGLDASEVLMASPANRRWLWGWILLAGLNLLVLLMLLWPEAENPATETAAHSAGNSALESWPAVEPVPEVPQQPYQAPAVSVSPPVADLENKAIKPLKPIPAAPPHAPVRLQRQQESVALKMEQPVTVPGIVKEDGLPVWPQISSELFRQLSGSLQLDVHVYADLQEDRFVLINLKKYHEGSELPEGPVLEEITHDGAILSFRGERFKVNAQ